MIDSFASRAAEWDVAPKIEMTRKFVEALKSRVKINKSWKALEIGAGTGLVGLQLLPDVSKVVFEDTSEAMLDVLRSKLQPDDEVEIVHGEVFAYQQQDIDFVFSCMAFHHIPDMEAALKHLSAITRQGAVVVVGDLRTEDGSFHRYEPIPHKGFDTEALSQLFGNAGFETELVETYNVLSRERTEGIITDYEQFILIARRK
ncbi:MAG: class I SAM-dependent methyltransferase [Paludibacter sp.]